jgi:hypothetical protein
MGGITRLGGHSKGVVKIMVEAFDFGGLEVSFKCSVGADSIG